MPKRQPHLIVNRRQVLQRLAIAGITLSGGYILYEYQPWLNYDRQAQNTWKSLKQIANDGGGNQVSISKSTDRSSRSARAISKRDRLGQCSPTIIDSLWLWKIDATVFASIGSTSTHLTIDRLIYFKGEGER